MTNKTVDPSSYILETWRKTFALRERCPYSELFWSAAFFSIRTEYGEIFCISPYSVRMREITDQNNSEYSHYLSSVA